MNLWRVRTAITGGSGSAQLSTMYFDATAPFTAQHAADAVRSFWNDCKNGISNVYTFQVEPDVFNIDTATGKAVASTGTGTLPVTGTEAGDPLPWATQALMRWGTTTFIGGRQIRGHTFIPGMVETNNTLGVPTAGLQTTFNAAAATLIGNLAAEFVIYSRKNGIGAVVTSDAMWSKWSVLRSRRD